MKVLNVPLSVIARDTKLITNLRSWLNDNEVVIIKKAFEPELIDTIKLYLNGICKNQLPNYYPIYEGAPNFYRLNFNDERSYVKGHFRQVIFYPWNQDLFSMYYKFRLLFVLKNLISELKEDKFLNRISEDGRTARIAFQFYDSGAGYLNPHKDPIDDNQFVLPSLVMSDKGKDFLTGGFYYYDSKNEKVAVEDVTCKGDVILFNGKMTHGVEIIDEEKTFDPFDLKGRWMCLFAINKLANSNVIGNSIDLGPN